MCTPYFATEVVAIHGYALANDQPRWGEKQRNQDSLNGFIRDSIGVPECRPSLPRSIHLRLSRS